jgi:hypothetical protein
LNADVPPLPGQSPFVGPPGATTDTPNRLRWWVHLVLITAYPLVLGVVGWGQAGVRGPALTHTAKGLVVVCVVELAVFGAVFGLAWLASRASREDLLWCWRGGFWTIPLGIGYSVAIRLASISTVMEWTNAKAVSEDQAKSITSFLLPNQGMGTGGLASPEATRNGLWARLSKVTWTRASSMVRVAETSRRLRKSFLA